MDSSVQELLDLLYNMMQDAWSIPLGHDRCVVERDKVIEILDEIKAKLPTEISEAKRLVAARTEFIAAAKREADSMKKVAEERARQLVDETEVLRVAREKSNEIIASAESRSLELRQVANQYADDTLMRTEEAINEALSEVRQARSRFRSLAAPRNTEE